MATPNFNDQHVTYWSEISRFLKKQYKFNWNKKKKFHKVLKGNLSFFCCCQVAVKLARQFWRFHVFFWVKTWNPRWFYWNRGPSCDGFIETGGRRPSCFNEYNRSVSSFNPQNYVKSRQNRRPSFTEYLAKKKYKSVSFETLL